MPKRPTKLGNSCIDCGIVLTEYNCKIISNKMSPRCESCAKIIANKQYSKWKYGISHEDYEKLFQDSNGKCEICGMLPRNQARLTIDHNHTTNKIRGLLCAECNLALGNVRENPAIIISMIAYLHKYFRG